MDFPSSEYQQRVAAARNAMAECRMDLLLVFGQEACCWLSGFYSHGHFAGIVLAIPLEGDPFLVLRQMEVQAAEETTWVADRRVYNDHEDAIAVACAAVLERGFGSSRIGVDKRSWYLTAKRYEKLQRGLPDSVFVDEDHMVARLRFVKSPLEVARIRSAASTVDAAMEAALAATKPGVSERKVAAAMAGARIEAGSGLPIDGVLTTGPRTLQGHGPWTDRRIESGDPFYYEFHGIVDHYWARMIRSGVVGKPSAEQEATARVLIGAQDAAISIMKPGAHARDIDAACREPIVEAGLHARASYTRRIGYSMGINFRPTPGEMQFEFTASADFVLAEGMVFFMLAMARGQGIGDMVLVTTDGAEVLGRVPRKFINLEKAA